MSAGTTETTRSDSSAANPSAERVRWTAPAVDVFENEREFLVVADLPGVSASDVQLHYDQGELRFEASGSVAAPGLGAGEGLGAVHFRRAFQLPDVVDAAGLNAELKNGTLTVHLPKQEALRPRQIVVRAV